MAAHIRPATSDDIHFMQDVHTRAVLTLCSTHYTREQIDAWLYGRTPEGYLDGIERGEMYVAEIDAAPAGFGHAVSGEVVAVFVDPDFVGRGAGRAILSHGLEMARRDCSDPIKLISTLNAQSFYEQFGFVAVEPTTVDKRGVDLPLVAMEMRHEKKGVLKMIRQRSWLMILAMSVAVFPFYMFL